MKTTYLAKGGIYTALSFILIYLSTILPTNKLALLALASCIIPISILTTNLKNSFLVYIAVSLLCFLLLGPKGTVLTYIGCFGLYGFVKYFVERIRRTPIEFMLKFAFLNSSILLLFFFYKTLFMGIIKIDFPIYFIFALLQILLLIYDYALTLFINYVDTRFIKRML